MNRIFRFLTESVIAFMLMSNVVFASDKTVNVDINKEYEKARFTLKFENPGDYESVLVAPNGDVFEFIQADETSASVVIGNLKTGTYSVGVSKKEREDASEDTSEDNAESDEIGKVTVTVKGVNDDSAVSSAIKVAKEISGLSIYLKDDDVVASWTDETVGNVHVTVTDAQTQEVLGNETVKDMYFSAGIPADTKEIIVNVIPSESEKISEAGEQYTLPNNNHPDATITYDASVITNKDTVKATVTLNDTYGLVFINNGEEVLDSVKSLKAGTYEYDIPVAEGDNEIKVYVVAGNGNMRSTALSIEKDTVPPQLTVDSDINGLSTYDGSVTISGRVTDFDVFTINGTDTKTDWEGYFSESVDLVDGSNHIVISAKDKAGNSAVYDWTVVKAVKEKQKITPQMIIAILLIIGLLIYFVVKYIRSHYQVVYEDIEGDEIVRGEKPAKASKGFDITRFAGTDAIIAIVVGILAVIFIFRVVLLAGFTASGSMEPTLKVGDVGISNRLAYIYSSPERGDIISFNHVDEESGIKYVYEKRVIGVAGDEITFSDGYVFINGLKAVEEYLDDDIETNCLKSFTVPEGCVFVLGDNRENSIDSRHWAEPYVNSSDIIAKLMVNLGQ